MKKILVLLAILLATTACKKVALYHDLTEEEANDIIVILQTNDISAEKIKEVRQNEIFWVIQVDPKKLAESRSLLVEHNLPRKRELGLSGVYKEKGLIPTPDEQKARFLLALKGEIINSLLKIPEVVEADVVLNIPTADEFVSPGAKEKRPTASVVIMARPSRTGVESFTEAKIQQFVANSVENLNPRDVSVIITYVGSPKSGIMPGQSLILPSAVEQPRLERPANDPVTRIAGLEVVGQSKSKIKIYMAIFFIILAVLAIALVVTVIKTSRMRSDMQSRGGDNKKLVEGRLVDDQKRLGDGN